CDSSQSGVSRPTDPEPGPRARIPCRQSRLKGNRSAAPVGAHLMTSAVFMFWVVSRIVVATMRNSETIWPMGTQAGIVILAIVAAS
ncbi:MAG: hypothetical protein ABI955_08540, partial [Nitrospirota bacterium]